MKTTGSKIQKERPLAAWPITFTTSSQVSSPGGDVEDGFVENSPPSVHRRPRESPSRRRTIIVSAVLISMVAITVGVVCVMMLRTTDSTDTDSAATADVIDVGMESVTVQSHSPSSPPVSSEDGDQIFVPKEDNVVQADVPEPESPDTTATDASDDNEDVDPIITTNDGIFESVEASHGHSPSISPTKSPRVSDSILYATATEEPTTLSPSPSPTQNLSTTPPVDDWYSEQPTDSPVVYDAVIIGAGWSGLRAAQILSEAGASVLILEANDYIGGRAKTVNLDQTSGVPTDLGCEWLYEGSAQESILDKLGLLGSATKNEEANYSFQQTVEVYVQNQFGAVEASTNRLFGLWGDFEKFKKNLLKEFGDVTYSKALDRFVDEMEINDEDKQYLNFVLDAGENEYSGDVDLMSASEVSFFFVDGPDPTHYMSIPGVGFGNVAASVASGIDAEFRLNSKVVGIDYEDEDAIISYEENGNKKKVTARSALVTVSLGVLKANTISFVPELPDWKQDAIDNMGFGLLNKVVMYWDSEDDIVWPLDTKWFGLITPEDETSGIYPHFFNPTELKGTPSLSAWISGKEAVAMEAESDYEILNHVMANLRSMFPDIREPDTVVTTRWAQDESFYGSYSFNTYGRDFYEDAANLKARVDNVWFAGEAANVDGWHATTAGAWDSGSDAAEDMLSFL